MTPTQSMIVAAVIGVAVAYGICCGYCFANGLSEFTATKWAWRICAAAGMLAFISFAICLATLAIIQISRR